MRGPLARFSGSLVLPLLLVAAPNLYARTAENCHIDVIRMLAARLEMKLLRADASVPEIQGAMKIIGANRTRLEKPVVDSQRLINEADWESALAEKFPKPWTAYGKTTMADWLKTLRFVNGDAGGRPATADLLKDLHRMTTAHMTFKGYEGRRIRKLFDEGKLTQPEFKERLRQVYDEERPQSGTDHAELRGQYRKEPIDQIVHQGSSFTADGTRYFTRHELESLRANPYMKVDEASIKEFKPGQFHGKAYFGDYHAVGANTDKVIKELDASLAVAKTPVEKIKAIVKMERDLVSIHPFLDGNGRTIRLFGDLIRRRNGLPPPLRPNEEDLTMTLDEAVKTNQRSMRDYVNEWLKSERREAAGAH